MAIQQRRGANADFDASKMLPGELAVTTDGSRKLYVAFAPGDVKELVSAEEVQKIVDEFDEDVSGEIEKAKEEIEQKKEEVLEDIPDYKKQIAELGVYKANSIITTSSGTVFHETDCAAVPPINIKLFGKSAQKTYEGNQLFDVEQFKNPSNWIEGLYYYQPLNLPAGTYTLSFAENNMWKGNQTDNAQFAFYIGTNAGTYEGNVLIGNYDANLEQIKNKYTFTIYEGTEWYANIYINVYAPTEEGLRIMFDELLIDTMLNKGTEALPYEPYVGAQPSPNIHYPQKIERHGESGSIGGKVLTGNLFDEEWEVGFIDNNGQDSNGSKIYWKTKNYIDVPIGKPRFVAGIEKQISACYVFYYDENKQLLSQEKVYSRLSNLNNLSWNPSAKFIRFYVEMPAETNNVKAYFGNVMISYNEDNTYEPYTEQPFEVLTPNGLRGVPLGQTIPDVIKNSPIHMSGVYWDGEQYQIADTENEDGKDVQRITTERLLADKVKIIDSLCNDESNLFYVLTSTYLASSTSKEFLCDITTYKDGLSIVNGSATHNGGLLNATALNLFYIRVRKDSGITTLDEFKEYLTNNEVYITLILPEPIITDTTEEEKAQLGTLIMNYPNTTIVNDAGAYMEVEYVADTKEHIKQNYVPVSEFEDLKLQVAEIQAQMLNL